MATRTLLELRTLTLQLSDAEAKTARHPATEVNFFINQSLTRLRELVSRNGHSYYSDSPIPGTFTAGTAQQTLGFQGARILNFIVHEGDEHWTLDDLVDAEYSHWRNQPNGRPLVFRIRGRFAAAGAVHFEVYPVPDQAYAYDLITLPEHAAMALDADLFDDPFAWAEWACADAAQKICTKDNDKDRFSLLALKKVEIEKEIATMAPKRSRVRVTRRRDTRTVRQVDNMAGRKSWWP